MSADRLKAVLEAIVTRVLQRVDYLAMYPSTVILQNADGSLELKPDNPKLAGMSKVPIRYGVPGVRAEVPAGARVAIEFEDGDPSKPIATVWDPDSGVTTLIFDDGTAPIARMGDIVNVFFPPTPIPVVGIVGVLAFVGTMTFPAPGIGIIGGGSPRCKG